MITDTCEYKKIPTSYTLSSAHALTKTTSCLLLFIKSSVPITNIYVYISLSNLVVIFWLCFWTNFRVARLLRDSYELQRYLTCQSCQSCLKVNTVAYFYENNSFQCSKPQRKMEPLQDHNASYLFIANSFSQVCCVFILIS